MNAPEIDDTDRALIDQYIAYQYAKHFNRHDMQIIQSMNELWRVIGKGWEKSIDERIDGELFNLRKQMKERGIKTENTGKGIFESMVRGYSHRVELNGEMAKLKAEKILQRIVDTMPEIEQHESCPKCGGRVTEGKCVNGDYIK